MLCRQGFSTLHSLLLLIEKWKEAVDESQTFGAFLTYQSKPFNCLRHNLLVLKLCLYGIFLPSLKLLTDYLTN